MADSTECTPNVVAACTLMDALTPLFSVLMAVNFDNDRLENPRDFCHVSSQMP